MSINRSIFIEKSTLDVLQELNELVKNKDAIKETHEILRIQMALTEDEKIKVNEARELIKNGDIISKKIQEEQKALELEKSNHARTVLEFSNKVKIDTESFMHKSAKIEKESARIATLEKQFIEDQKQLEFDKKKYAQEQTLAIAELHKTTNEALAAKQYHDDLAKDILAVKLKMKQKAQEAALRAQEAAEF